MTGLRLELEPIWLSSVRLMLRVKACSKVLERGSQQVSRVLAKIRPARRYLWRYRPLPTMGMVSKGRGEPQACASGAPLRGRELDLLRAPERPLSSPE